MLDAVFPRYKKNSPDWLQRFFWGLFLLFPFCMALKYQALLNGQGTSFVFSLGMFIFFGALFALINLKLLETGKPWRRDLAMVVFVMGITLFLRLLAVRLIDTKPISDFAYADQLARAWSQGAKSDYYFSLTPYNAVYTTLLGWIYALFGAKIIVAEYFNIFCAMLTTACLYFLGKKVAKGKWQVGLVAALIFACWPSMVAYSNILSGENIFVFFFALVTWAYSLIRDYWRRLKVWQWVTAYAILGLLIGVMDSFKPIAVVFMIALVITEWVDHHDGVLYNRKTWLKVIAYLAVCFLFYSAGKSGLYAFMDYKTQHKVYRSGYVYTLYTGMHFSSDGQFSQRSFNDFLYLLGETHNDFKKVDSWIMRITLAEVKANPEKIIPLWIDKFKTVWASDDVMLTWANSEKLHPDSAFLGDDFYNYINPALNYFFTFIIFLSACGSLYAIFHKPDAGLLLVSLFIFGVALLLLITEVQQRYHSNLTPALALTAAWGLECISVMGQKFQNWFQQRVWRQPPTGS